MRVLSESKLITYQLCNLSVQLIFNIANRVKYAVNTETNEAVAIKVDII